MPDQGTTWLPILYYGYSRLNLFAEISLKSPPSAGAILIKTTFWQLRLIFYHPNFFPILVTTTTIFDTYFNNGCSFFLCSNQCKGWQYHHLYQNVTGACNLVHFQLFGVSQFSKCGLSTYRNAFKHYPTSNSGNIFKNSASTSNLIYFINTSALFCLSTYVQKWSDTLQDPYNETNDNGNGTLSYVGGKNSLQFPPVIRGYCC